MFQEVGNIKKVLLDVNVCIDFLTQRLLDYRVKKQLFAIFLDYKLEVFIPSFSIDTIFYILHNSLNIDKEVAKKAIQSLLNYTLLLHVNDEVIFNSFTSNFSDFENGLIHSLATNKNIDCIITSNIKDFKKSTIAVYRPIDFVSLYED
ncbi:MAG: PIN domain-containing protein [Salinivirgaceae bacterium]|jgi:predicted nucleic acid-binding protein|nr:PIN domain-containing protein [Salinivirgaceae bacterium]